MSNCKGIFGRLFGHAFQAHHNVTPPPSIQCKSGSPTALAEVIRAMSERKVIAIVCRRCGERKELERA